MSDILIRPATTADAPTLSRLITTPANRGLVLPRDTAEICGVIASFQVAVKGRDVIGCVSVRDFGQGLFEVRSLVVAPDCMGHGLGSRLVAGAWEEAVAQGALSVFTLTYRPHVFERLGFVRVDKARFPQKVWLDCVKCAKRDHCDEIALLRAVR